MKLDEPLVNVGIRLGLPRSPKGRDLASVTLDVRVTGLHLVIGGAIAVAIVWLALRRPGQRGVALEQQPGELQVVRALPEE